MKMIGTTKDKFYRAKAKAFNDCYFRILRRIVTERYPQVIIEVNALVHEEMSRHLKYGKSLTD